MFSINRANFFLNPVVITRPLVQAQAFATRVLSLGRAPVILPLLEIFPISDVSVLHRVLDNLNRYALVIFVSPNAINFVLPYISYWPSNVIIGIVGENSRLALKRYDIIADNVTIICPQKTDKMGSEALLKILDMNYLRGKCVLIVRAQTGRNLLTNVLQAAQIRVDYLVAYRRLKPKLDHIITEKLRFLAKLDSEWIVTSSEVLYHLLALATQALDIADILRIKQQKIVVSHERSAEIGKLLGFSNIIITGSGDESLIAAL